MKLLKFPEIDHVESCIHTVLKSIHTSEHSDYYLELVLEGLVGLNEDTESLERFKIDEHIFMALLLLRYLKKFSYEN